MAGNIFSGGSATEEESVHHAMNIYKKAKEKLKITEPKAEPSIIVPHGTKLVRSNGDEIELSLK